MNGTTWAHILERMAEAKRIEAECFQLLSNGLASSEPELAPAQPRPNVEMSLGDVAARANVSLSVVQRAVKSGALKVSRLGVRTVRVSQAAYLEWRGDEARARGTFNLRAAK